MAMSADGNIIIGSISSGARMAQSPLSMVYRQSVFAATL